MDFEQKYNDARERMKSWARGEHPDCFTEAQKAAEFVFPELAESEDEKHRNWILEYLYDGLRKADEQFKPQFEAAIAWLEKQQPFDKDKVAKEFLRSVAISIMNWLDGNIPEDKMCLSNMECEDIENAVRNADWNKIYAYMKKKLEKQGEQKQAKQPYSYELEEEIEEWLGCEAFPEGTNITPLPKAMEIVRETANHFYDFGRKQQSVRNIQCTNSQVITPESYINEGQKKGIQIVLDNPQEYGLQKSTDKVEPKFKVGDWVVFIASGSIYQVEKIENYEYTLRHILGGSLCLSFSNEKLIREWTIADAKDGDVLAFDDNTIIIFKDLYNATTFHSYCHIEDGLFGVSEDGVPDWWEGKGFYPATKEQRDLLFQKMKEAGYEWGADKKELKKILNATEECEIEHIEHGKYYYCIKDYYSGGRKRASKGEVVQALRGMNMMALGVEANKYFIPVKSIVRIKPAWSEEDEKFFNDTIAFFENKNALDHRDWVKSLKQRIVG